MEVMIEIGDNVIYCSNINPATYDAEHFTTIEIVQGIDICEDGSRWIDVAGYWHPEENLAKV